MHIEFGLYGGVFMRKVGAAIFYIVVIILFILALVIVPKIAGNTSNVLVKDLVAILYGIPISLLVVGIMGLIAILWNYTIGKVVLIGAIILIVILIIIFWRKEGKRRDSLSLLFLRAKVTTKLQILYIYELFIEVFFM